MEPSSTDPAALLAENAALRVRLEEAEDTLRAIRTGEVDALVVEGEAGPQVFILQSTDAESNRFRSDILGKVNDAVIAVNQDRRIIYINSAAEKQYGVVASEVLGCPAISVFELKWLSSEDQRASAISLHETGHWRGRNIHIKTNGQIIHVESSVSRLTTADGEPIGMLGVVRDVTAESEAADALRESEERYRSLFNSIEEGFCVIELIYTPEGRPADYRFLQVSPSFEKHTGLANVLGKTVRELVPDHEQFWYDMYASVIETGEPVSRLSPAKALDRWFEFNASPFGPPAKRQVAVLFNDVTKRVLAEEAMRENQARLQLTLESAEIGDWDLNLATDTARCSLRHNRIFGYSEPVENWGFTRFLSHVHRDERRAVEKLFANAVAERADLHFEARILRVDGEVRWINIHAKFFSPSNENSERMIGIVTDITDRKHAEETLRHSEALFSKIIDQAPGGVYVVDDQFRMMRVNSLARPTFESAEPIIGRDFNEIIKTLWGEETGSWIASIFRHTLDTGERHISERFTGHREDITQERTYDWETHRLTLPNGRHGVVCYYTDVTAQKALEDALRESEQRANNVIQSITDGFLSMDRSWRITYLSARGAEILAPLKENISSIIGRVFWEEFPHTVGTDIERNYRRAMENQQPVQFEAFYPPLNSWFDLRVYPSASGMSLFFLDITERKNAEEALRENQGVLAAQAEALRAADRSKDEFLAMLAHELRNPLAPMRNAIEILQSQVSGTPRHDYARNLIARQIENMSRIIDDLLDVSRITEGKIELRREQVELGGILAATADSIRHHCEANRQELELVLPPAPLHLYADATRLEQVFGNLLSNATKYSGTGSRITLAAHSSCDSEAVIVIQDNGIGIDSKLLPRIFDLFVQSSRTLDRSHGGLGIGLTIVHRLVLLHGGSIEAHSEGHGLGTRFTIRLPIIPPPEKDLPAVPSRDAEPRHLRLLIVDDNCDAAETMAMFQQLKGHDTRLAHNGPDAVAAAAEFLPEAVLLDIGLPGMDGYEVARRIRLIPELEDVYLIALTGYGNEEDRQLSSAAGFDKHLVKPADLDLLTEIFSALPVKVSTSEKNFG